MSDEPIEYTSIKVLRADHALLRKLSLLTGKPITRLIHDWVGPALQVEEGNQKIVAQPAPKKRNRA